MTDCQYSKKKKKKKNQPTTGKNKKNVTKNIVEDFCLEIVAESNLRVINNRIWLWTLTMVSVNGTTSPWFYSGYWQKI